MTINSIYLIVAVIATFATALISSSSYVIAVPPDPNYDSSNTCGAWTTNGDLTKRTCCWTERVAGKLPPNNKANYCQTCTNNTADGTQNCNKPQQQLRPSSDAVSPEGGVLEQPPSQNGPPLKSDNSIAPNDGNNAINEQQSNPNPPLTDQRVPPGNVGVLEQLDDSSNNEHSQESDELNEANNADTTSSNQENDDLSTSETTNSEMTTSFAKKGNTQNSPVPPECPKQGPIPPDCTMKPKF
jgi:hypothetical protein